MAALRDYEWQRRKGRLPACRAEANGVKGTDFRQDAGSCGRWKQAAMTLLVKAV